MRLLVKILAGYLLLSLVFSVGMIIVISAVLSGNPIITKLERDVDRMSSSLTESELIAHIVSSRIKLEHTSAYFASTQDTIYSKQNALIESEITADLETAINKADVID